MRRTYPGLPALLLVAAAFAAAACSSSAAEPTDESAGAIHAAADPRGKTARLRVVASNLTSGNTQSYDPGEGARILQGLAPDVALMQEFNYGENTPAELRGFVDKAFGADFAFTREERAQIPNGVISRYPIVDSGTWTDPETASRSFAWARIDVPGETDLWAVSVHLLSGGSAARVGEAKEIVARIRATVPETDFVVVGGDFNTGSRGEGCMRAFGELFRTTAPFPVDGSGNGHTSATRSKPLDWVLAGRELDALEMPVKVGSLEFAHGLVFDSRVFRPIVEAPPVLSSDSAALNMQHMAVVRDFALPLPL